MQVTLKLEAEATHTLHVQTSQGLVEVPPGKARTVEVTDTALVSIGRPFPGWLVWNAEREQARLDAEAAQASVGQSEANLGQV